VYVYSELYSPLHGMGGARATYVLLRYARCRRRQACQQCWPFAVADRARGPVSADPEIIRLYCTAATGRNLYASVVVVSSSDEPVLVS
jgi:hypothetical protein